MPTLTAVDFDPFAPAPTPRLTAVDHDPFAQAAPAVQSAPAPNAVRLGEDAAPDYAGVFRPSVEENGGVGRGALRAMVGRVPDLIAGALELPANANEAVIRALGMEPDPDGVFGAIRGGLRNASDAVRGLGYSEDMDAANYGLLRVSSGELVEALNPYANANRAESAAEVGGNFTPLTMGERLGDIGTFALDQGIASIPDMVATLNPLTLAGYIGSRTNEVAENRAANDRREQVSLTDLGIAAPAATFEALLERFTTMRLLPGGTTLATPGAKAAITRIAKEVGIQAPLGGIEEVAPYLAETVGTETGASPSGVLESFLGGVVGEGAIGGAVASAKEGVNALRRTPQAAPGAIDVEQLNAGLLADLPSPAPAAPTPEITPDDADLDALMLRNLLGEDVAAVLGLPQEPESADPDARFRRPAPASVPTAPPAIAATEVRSSQSAQTPTTAPAVQAPAGPSAPVPADADLTKLGEDAPEPIGDTGKLYQRGNGKNNSSAQALQLPGGTWQVRTRKSGQWQPWQPRDTFDASPTFGYRETAMGGGAVTIPGIGRMSVAKAEAQPKSAPEYNPLRDLIAGAGGISRDDAARMGVDPKELNARHGIRPLYGKAGIPLDSLREMMEEAGYFPAQDPDAPPQIGVNEVWELASKALAGESVGPLGDPQMLERQMQAAQADRYGEDETQADRDPDEDLAAWFDEIETEASEALPIGDEAEALSIGELAARAAAAGVDGFDLARSTNETDAAYAGRLWDATYQEEARRGHEREAEESRVRDGVRPGQSGQAGLGDFALEGQPAEAAAAQEVAPAPSAGLFGAPSTRDFTDAATRARDAKRDGKDAAGRADMLAGDGELFAGKRPEQTKTPEPGALPPHLRDMAAKMEARGFGSAAVSDVTPDGFGPGEPTADSVSTRPGDRQLTTEERRVRNSIDEAKTLLRGKMEAPKRAAIERQMARDEQKLEALQSAEALESTDTDADPFTEASADASREDGERDATRLGLRSAVDALLGTAGHKVEYLRGYAGLPERLRTGVQQRNSVVRKGATAALYDPRTGRVFVFTHVTQDPDVAAWDAAHEIAGHHGLRTLLGDQLDKALGLALQNPTVSELAAKIYAERNFDARAKQGRKTADQLRLESAEEALAELAAATRTGEFGRIQERYGVPVPEGVRAKVARAIDNFLKRLKALFDQRGVVFKDAQVRELIEAAWQAARGEGGSIGGMAESVSETPAVQPLSRAKFFARYSQHKDVRAKSPEEAEATAAIILREGFKRMGPGINVTPAYRGGRPADVVARAYGPRVGDVIYLVPKEAIVRNKVAAGWTPEPYEVVRPTEDYQDLYELYVAAVGKHNTGAFDPDNDSIMESVEYTPEQVEFMRKAGLSGAVDTRTSLQRVIDWARGKQPDIDGDSLIQATLDQFHGLKRATQEAGITDTERNAYIAARQINTGSTMEAILLYGAPKLEGGALRVNRDVPGLLQALGPVGKTMPQFLGWLVARRAQALKRQGRENLMTDADIAAGLALAKGHEAAFQQAAGDYLRLKNAILDLAEQTGTVDPAARAMWDSIEYVPFYREKEGAAAGPGTRQGLANQSSGIRKLRGGESALTDPLANIIQNFTRLVDSAMKNRATMLAVDSLGAPYFRPAALAVKAEVIPLDQVKKHLIATGTDPATVDALPDAALKGVAKMLAIKAPEGDDIVRLMRNGKAEYHHVDDPLLLRALTAFNEVPTHAGVKPFVWAKQLLTAGATATPEFLAANTLRDTGEAWATAGNKFLPLVDTLRGAWQNVTESELTQDLMMAGSAFHSGYFHTGRNDDTAKAIRRALRKGGMAQGAVEKHLSTLYNPKRWWDLYRSGMEASEMGSRILLAQRHMEAGGSFLEAAHEAKDFLDFSMRGDDRFVQFFTSVLPFLNARLQGGYRLARVGTTQGRRGKLASRMGMIALASTSLYLWNTMIYGAGYEDLEDWDKDAYWHIAPGTERHVRIPKPFEIGLVAGTFVERMWAALAYQLTDGEQADRPKATLESFVRGIVHTMAIDPIPQLARPVVEVQSNRNRFFDSPIESLGDKFKAPEDRFAATTSDTMKAASRGMTALLGDDKALSPKQLQHLWRGYTAGVGGYLLDSTDWVLRRMTDAPERPDMALRDFPLVGRFARGGNAPASTKYMDEFYTLRDQAQQQSDRVKQAVIDGDSRKAERIDREFGWLLGGHEDSNRAKGGFMHVGLRALNKVGDELAALRKADQAIYNSRTMTGAEKRAALDANNAAKNAAVRRAVRQANEAERKYRATR